MAEKSSIVLEGPYAFDGSISVGPLTGYAHVNIGGQTVFDVHVNWANYPEPDSAFRDHEKTLLRLRTDRTVMSLNAMRGIVDPMGLIRACIDLAPWMSAAIGDPKSCREFQAAASAFVEAITPADEARIPIVKVTDTVTGDQVRDAMSCSGTHWVKHHACSICYRWVHYLRQGCRLFFDSNCDCPLPQSQPRETTWQDAASFINDQTNLDVRRDVMIRFGFVIEPDKEIK